MGAKLITTYSIGSFFYLFLGMFFCQNCALKLPKILNENSGIARISTDSFVFLNDSGNKAALYSTNRRGKLRDSVVFFGEINHDWEELARDAKTGRFFIGDFGNNSNARRDLRILIFSPENHALDSLTFSWPNQSEFPPKSLENRNFDCEAMVFWQDSLHLFTKSHWQGHSFLCEHWVLPAKTGRQTPIFREKTTFKNRVISGAALTENGQVLALVGYEFGLRWHVLPHAHSTVFLCKNDGKSAFFNQKIKKIRPKGWPLSRQYEAICFENDHQLWITNERLLWQKSRIRKIMVNGEW
jgi:hypothetical protein